MTFIQISGDRRTIRSIGKGKKWLLWSGIFLMLIGVAAIAFPIAASIATALFVGWLLVFSGFFHFLTSLTYQRARTVVGSMLVNLLTIALGLLLVFNPSIGIVTITMLIALLFVLHGVAGLFIASMIKPFNGWRWLFASAIISILAGVLIGLGTPDASQVLLGLLVGLNFIVSGLSCVMFARAISLVTRTSANH